MTSEQASRLVIASLIVVALVSIFANVAKGRAPQPRVFIAGGIVYLGLGMASDFAPAVAGPMAVLIMLAVLLTEGTAAFGAFRKRLG